MALKISVGDELERVIESLDSAWEEKLIDRAPFLIAYSLNRLKKENYDWTFLLRDTLNAILRYLALISVNEYLQASMEPDYELNEEIKTKITRPVSEGTWFDLYKKCLLKVDAQLKIPELLESYDVLEGNKDFEVRIDYPRYEKKVGKLGLLQSLIFLRNRDAHGPFLEKNEMHNALLKVLGILRANLFLLEPVLKYEYCQKIKEKDQDYYLLQGIKNFEIIEYDAGLSVKTQNFLRNPETKSISLILFPFVLAEKEKGSLGNLGELYLLNYLTKSSPEYEGLALGIRSKKEYLRHVLSHFKLKRVFEKKKDVELESLEEFALQKGKQKLEFLKDKNLYDPEHFVQRKDFEENLSLFLDSDKNIFLVFGKSGCGKTSALCHFTKGQIEDEQVALFLRCETLAPILANPLKLEEYLLSEFGYEGKLDELLNYLEKKKKRFILIFDGINEFSWTSERIDSSHLFLTINQLITKLNILSPLKIVISSRIENKREMFKEDEHFYSFIPEDKYFLDTETGKYFYILNEFSEKELTKAMDVFSFEEDEAEMIKADKKGTLKNPFLFKLFSENIASGKKIKKVSENRIIGANIKKKLKDKKKLVPLLDQLIKTMDRLKDMNPSLERLREKKPRLYKRLTWDKWRALNQLEDIEMTKIQDVYGEKGIASKVISYNHDKIFKFMKRRQNKQQFRNLLMFILTILFLFLSVNFIVEVPIKKEKSKVESLISELIEKIKTSGEINTQDKELAVVMVKIINNFGLRIFDILTKSIRNIVLFMLALFIFLIVLLTVVYSIFNKAVSKLWDFRVNYLRGKLKEEISRRFLIFVFIFSLLIIAQFIIRPSIVIFISSCILFVLILIFWYLRFFHKKIIQTSSLNLLHANCDKRAVKYTIFLYLATYLILLSAVLGGCYIAWGIGHNIAGDVKNSCEQLEKDMNLPHNLGIQERLIDAGILKNEFDTSSSKKFINDVENTANNFKGIVLHYIVICASAAWFFIGIIFFGYGFYLCRHTEHYERLFSKPDIFA